ncbi:MAG: DUF5107 domain-containing protein [Verrucomicrobia bacterium]|nr:DUF5107 domain-containing protein [Verrucomicrobiota bacterium]
MPAAVTACFEDLILPTYPVGRPEKNPVFFEKRVYQGSNGKVYPVPFIDKVFDEPHPVRYRSVRLENDHVRLVLLPEIGGRVLRAQDKTNRDYDFFYRQDVIKPALVGLAGPWISGGVEFNWPQHHRPGTFLPADAWIEEEADGARTVWCAEHDPMGRRRELHGLRLRPGSALIELRVRLHNCTALPQTFLWWANVAARVHDQYQSFFPPDVHYVADHAVRAQVSFPIAQGPYYGVPYQDRPGANDLTWYRHIPVPTSYMVCETAFDFFGGYDHAAQGGFVHVANRHLAPGKKQWTWGNHAFGHAWDRELTDQGGPYIELMAGVYTDNQPDFSYLAPGETKVFSQYWWPLQRIGPVQAANEHAALRLVIDSDGRLDFGAAAAAPLPGARLVLREGDRPRLFERLDLAPGRPFVGPRLARSGGPETALELTLEDAAGRPILSYRHTVPDTTRRTRPVAVEPPEPAATGSADELFFAGEHLEQYDHPTRAPEAYWREALRRDPGDARCHLALGRRLLRRGELAAAAEHLGAAVARLTARHPNPMTGEAHYHLGLVRRWQGRGEEAYALFYKATWDYAWRAPAYLELANLDGRRGDWSRALAHLDASLDTNRLNNRALVLRAVVLRRLGRAPEAAAALAALRAVDPLDPWAHAEAATTTDDWEAFLALTRNDAQTILDVVFDYAEAGLLAEALAVLERHHAAPVVPVAVPNPQARSAGTRYALAWLQAQAGAAPAEVTAALADARAQSPDYFFPSRLQEQIVLEWALTQPGQDPLAHYGLGNLFYDRRRHLEAMAHWERCVASGVRWSTPHRNLGIAAWNVRRDGSAARAAYAHALALDPSDARLVYEADQLRKKLNDPLEERLAFLEQHRGLVDQRDDASVELAALYNLLNRPAAALALLSNRRFHPWEGGEGVVLREYKAAHLLLGRAALAAGDAAGALRHFSAILQVPANLGEAWHLHQAVADVNYWLGRALRALGRDAEAAEHFAACAAERGDFSEMAVAVHSPLGYHRGLALRELGREEEARRVFVELRAYGLARIGQPARIDYFATSLPNLLVFDEDLSARRDAEHHLLVALGAHGLGEATEARTHLAATLRFSRADRTAVELARELG